MFGYIRRARALAATIRRVEGEVVQLQQAVRDIEQRCHVTLERARLENLAAIRSMEAESERVEKAASALFEQMRRDKADTAGPLPVGRRNGPA